MACACRLLVRSLTIVLPFRLVTFYSAVDGKNLAFDGPERSDAGRVWDGTDFTQPWRLCTWPAC
jgi:hypothetical protein